MEGSQHTSPQVTNRDVEPQEPLETIAFLGSPATGYRNSQDMSKIVEARAADDPFECRFVEEHPQDSQVFEASRHDPALATSQGFRAISGACNVPAFTCTYSHRYVGYPVEKPIEVEAPAVHWMEEDDVQ